MVGTRRSEHRCPGYVRVSTEDQAPEGVSLEAQRARIEACMLAVLNRFERNVIAERTKAALTNKRAGAKQ